MYLSVSEHHLLASMWGLLFEVCDPKHHVQPTRKKNEITTIITRRHAGAVVNVLEFGSEDWQEDQCQV